MIAERSKWIYFDLDESRFRGIRRWTLIGLRLCFFWYPSAMGWTDALLRISLSCGVLRFSFSRHFEGGWRCQQHAIITIYRSDEAAASLYRVLMMRLLDGRPRSNPDLVPPHRCSYSRIGVLVGCSALVKRPLSSRGFQARLELDLYRLSISRPSFVTVGRRWPYAPVRHLSLGARNRQ